MTYDNALFRQKLAAKMKGRFSYDTKTCVELLHDLVPGMEQLFDDDNEKYNDLLMDFIEAVRDEFPDLQFDG